MTALLWSRDAPTRCACGGVYRPQLNAKGMLVKAKEPAWRMAEQTRDPGCLQERCRALAKFYRTGYQHHKHSRGSGAGYPDCHFWAPRRPDGGGSVFVELKRMDRGYPSDRDNPTPAQIRVMGELQDAGHPVYLCRPCCLLVGVIDELVAALAGVRCRYVEGDRAGPVFPIEPAPTMPAHAEALALGTGRRPMFRPQPLPGRDPVPFAPAVGVVVPQPATDTARDAMAHLEAWLRQAGFSPYDVPYPIRLVTMGLNLHVQCRIGLARPGNDVRVWRGGTPVTEFPDDLGDALDARLVFGPSSTRVQEQIAGTSEMCGM